MFEKSVQKINVDYLRNDRLVILHSFSLFLEFYPTEVFNKTYILNITIFLYYDFFSKVLIRHIIYIYGHSKKSVMNISITECLLLTFHILVTPNSEWIVMCLFTYLFVSYKYDIYAI